MDELTSRQRQILTLIVESYIDTRLPVGSRTLAERYGLNLSPASVRHEMGVLEELGFLTHPHTSAGRLPTDKGYQFYVHEVVKEEPVSQAFVKLISRELKGRIESLESLMERSSRILSAMAQEAALLISPQLRKLYLKELSLVPLDETQLIAVWCTTSGLVKSSVVEMETPISKEELERILHFINEELAGAPIGDLEKELLERIESRRDSLRRLYEQALRIIQTSISLQEIPRVFVEGSRYILDQPEFQDVKKFQSLIATLEEKSSLIDLLKNQSLEQGVHVAIGEKELCKEIWDCAFVSAPYVWHGRCVGTIGILGPRRMPYGRIMGLVRRMSDEMSQALDRRGT